MKTAAVTAQIYNEITNIIPFDDLEQEHLTDTLAWIQSGVNIFRIAKPDKPPKHLVSYVVFIDPDHNSILLGDHIKSQLWLPTGGHVLLNEHPKDAAVRELKEELSQEAVFIRNNEHPFFLTVTKTVGLTPGHTDVSLWYLLRGAIHDSLHINRDEFNDMSWFTFDEILQSHPAIFDQHMQRFTRKLVNYLQPGKP